MFISVIRLSDNAPVIIRKDAIRFVEPHPRGMTLHVDGVGEIPTSTYDLCGFGSLIANIDDDHMAAVLEDAT